MNVTQVPGSVQLALLAIITLLATGSLVSVWLKKTKPEKNYHELRQRVRTWWFIVAFFMAGILFSRTISVCVFGLVSFLAFKEYLSLIPTRRADHRVLFWAYLAIPVRYLLGLDGLVWLIHYFYPGLHVPAVTDAHAADR